MSMIGGFDEASKISTKLMKPDWMGVMVTPWQPQATPSEVTVKEKINTITVKEKINSITVKM